MEPEASSAKSLRGALDLARRRWWLITLTAVIAAAVAFALASTRPARYRAEADVLVRRQDIAAALGASSGSGTNEPADRYLQTQADLARVPELAERVVAAVEPDGYTADELLANSSVMPRTNADFLEFAVEDADPALAARLVTEYAEQFTTYEAELATAALAEVREDLEARISELERSGDRSSPLYTSLSQRAQQVRTLEALQATSAFVVRPASAGVQVAPTPRRDAVLGAFAGLVLGIGAALLLESLDTSVRTATAAARQLRLPLLGRLPTPARRHRRPGDVVMLRSPTGPEAEAFRLLRGAFQYANRDVRARVVMVTSAGEGEGKTTTAANLAVALARSGTDVVLVDADLRNPGQHVGFDVARAPGLTDVALGVLPLDEALVPVTTTRPDAREAAGERGRLWLLPAGPAVPDTGELFTARGFADVMARLREREVLVLVDTSPFLVAGDAMAMTAHADAVLVVARLGRLKRAPAAELRRLLDRSPAQTLGLVVTGGDADPGYVDLGEYGETPAARPAAPQPVRTTEAGTTVADVPKNPFVV